MITGTMYLESDWPTGKKELYITIYSDGNVAIVVRSDTGMQFIMLNQEQIEHVISRLMQLDRNNE